MNHDEHLEWAKVRAREYLARHDPDNAVASMISDLNKHSDWSGGRLLATMLMVYSFDRSPANASRIIEGFN